MGTFTKNVDLYGILEVTKGKTPTDIKRAYRLLALKYHPDKNPDDFAVAEKFEEINRAHAILHDPSRRQIYDNSLTKVSSCGILPISLHISL
ncbi:unnamed protein product [Echinostoma caproni]|uniref:J domain-containing protein n=1 Tax=Echinostoma caproni TaxID=27848 RepID=A0A183A0S3_9TREM|nr:unnamed protein product [Echinostoma caproni]